MPLNIISLAISPYVSRTAKAIQFYKNNKDKNSDKGLMLCIAEGPTNGWTIIDGIENVPLPTLDTKQLLNPIGFKRFKNMYFVVPNNSGNIFVAGIAWSRIFAGSEETLYDSAFANNARWLYIEAELEPTEFVGETYRQVGLYSDLKINTSVVTDYATRERFLPSEIVRTGSASNYIYDGILEVYQNKPATRRPVELKETFLWVLEF